MHLLLVALMSFAAWQAVPQDQPARIIVKGTGEARAVPDQATLEVSILTRSAEAAAAAADNATLQDQVLRALRAAGVPDEQLATLGYSVQAEYARDQRRPRKLVGYVAQSRVRVGPVDPTSVGKLIDTALAAGANRIGAVRFSTSDPARLQRQALAAAVRDAHASAETIAQAAGGHLGALLRISTEPQGPRATPLVYDFKGAPERAAAQPETPIEVGEIVVRATVTAQWLYEPER